MRTVGGPDIVWVERIFDPQVQGAKLFLGVSGLRLRGFHGLLEASELGVLRASAVQGSPNPTNQELALGGLKLGGCRLSGSYLRPGGPGP